MAKVCKEDQCVNPVWGKGLCKHHQYLRDDIVKGIKKVSDKQAKRLQSYNKAKEKVDYSYCFFCGLEIKRKDEKKKPHHLVPRSYSLKLYDNVLNLVPTHFHCHRNFHDMPNSLKKNQKWYYNWLSRILAISKDYYLYMLHKTQPLDEDIFKTDSPGSE